MSVKPLNLYLWVVAVTALLSYGIVSLILSHPFDNRENTGVAGTDAADYKTLPEAYFFDEKDQKTTLADFRGNVVLVNLWATWCTPCVAELPSLDKLQAKLDEKGLKIVAISMDRKGGMEEVKAFLAKHGADHLAPYLDKDRQILGNWKYEGIPVSFLIDAQGRLRETLAGPYEWDTPKMVAKVAALLD